MSRPIKFVVAILILISYCQPAQAEINLDSFLTESIGGPKALERFKQCQSVTIGGTINQNGMLGKFIQHFVAPDKIYYTIDFPGFKTTDGYNGQVAWRKDFTGKVTELKGAENARLKKMLYFWSLSYLIDGRTEGNYSYSGVVTFEGHQYHQVDFELPGCQPIAHLFGVESITDQIQLDKLDNLEIITYRSNFQSVESVMYPFSSVGKAEAAGLTISMEIDSVILDGFIDQNIFDMPSNQNSPDFVFISAKDSVVVPFNYYQGHLYVEIEIRKGKRFWFILDTGASATMLNRRYFSDYGFKQVGTVPAKGVVDYENVDLVKIDSLSIGEVLIYDILAGLIDLPPGLGVPPTGLQLGGAIGYDFFSRFPILIDFDKSTMTVYRESPPVEDSSQIVDFYLNMQVPTISVTISDGVTILDSIKGDFLIDLGNPMGLLFHKPFVDQFGLDSLLVGDSNKESELGGIGGRLSATKVIIPRLLIGKQELHHVPAIIPGKSKGAAGSTDLAGNIGNEILQNFRLLLEYPDSRIRLLPRKL